MSFSKTDTSLPKRKSLSLELKLQVLRRSEAGERQIDISNSLNLAPSTVRTILKNSAKIKLSGSTSTKMSVTKITRSRSNIIEEMEKRLSIWVDDQTQRNMPLSQKIIMEKAKSIFHFIQNENGDESESFMASRGWFDRFKKRSNLHSIKITGEAASADHQAALEFPEILKTVIEHGNYPLELIFNVDETGLFWKRMPSRTFISREEKCAPGFKAAKDRLTLLLGCNATGSFKLKPMLVYHSQTPRAMKGISKSALPVIWEANKKAWVTTEIFQKWFLSYFCPSVKRFCQTENLEPKALLLLDNAPGHPSNLDTLQTDIPVEVIFLPPNTTSLIQPMDQMVIANFKAYYLRHTFRQLIEKTDSEEKQTIRQFWKEFSIMNAIDNIDAAWKEITPRCMTSAWKKIMPQSCAGTENDDERPSSVIENIVQLANEIGLEEVNEDDVEELLQSHGEELTNEELEEIASQCKLHVPGDADMEEGNEETPKKELTTEFLSNSLATITQIMEQFVENDPDDERSSKVKRGVMSMLSCYHEMLKERRLRKRQTTLNHFIFKKTKVNEEPTPGPSTE